MRVLVAEELLDLPDIGRGAPFGPDGAVTGTLRVCFRTLGILSAVCTQVVRFVAVQTRCVGAMANGVRNARSISARR